MDSKIDSREYNINGHKRDSDEYNLICAIQFTFREYKTNLFFKKRSESKPMLRCQWNCQGLMSFLLVKYTRVPVDRTAQASNRLLLLTSIECHSYPWGNLCSFPHSGFYLTVPFSPSFTSKCFFISSKNVTFGGLKY